MDWLIRGGTVLPMDGKHRSLRGDVLIRGDRIHRVGKIVPDRPCRIVDARGHIVMPGFVQAHVHLCQALFRGLADDLPLLSWLRTRIWPLEAAHDPASLRASAQLGLAEMLLAGTTTILDMGTVHDHEAVMETLAASGMRALSGKAMMDTGEGVPARLKESQRESVDSSVALFDAYHGTHGGRLGYAFAPRFILSCSEGLLRETATVAAARRAIVHTHAAEHADERRAVRDQLGVEDIEALARVGIAGPTAVLAHGVQLTAEEMAALGDAGTRVVHCPSANLKLASGIANVRAMRAAGITVGLGADGAPCNNRMDPFTELRQAALLAKAQSEDAAALSAHEALTLATIEGARALGLDTLTGSLEAGKQADLITVRTDGLHCQPGADPIATIVYAATARDVCDVFVAGAALVREGRLTRWDAREIRARAQTEQQRVLKRAKLA